MTRGHCAASTFASPFCLLIFVPRYRPPHPSRGATSMLPCPRLIVQRRAARAVAESSTSWQNTGAAQQHYCSTVLAPVQIMDMTMAAGPSDVRTPGAGCCGPNTVVPVLL